VQVVAVGVVEPEVVGSNGASDSNWRTGGIDAGNSRTSSGGVDWPAHFAPPRAFRTIQHSPSNGETLGTTMITGALQSCNPVVLVAGTSSRSSSFRQSAAPLATSDLINEIWPFVAF